MSSQGLKMEAVISNCKNYRYLLKRTFDPNAISSQSILFIMLNPSTADEKQDDPTIRRCEGFAKREGFGRLTVVNLFARRSKNPKDLLMPGDPIGPENDLYIANEIANHSVIVAAWGASKFAIARAKEITSKYGPFLCLGKTADGHPKHPLYVRADSTLIPIAGIVNPGKVKSAA